jgi:hypothetical protein
LASIGIKSLVARAGTKVTNTRNKKADRERCTNMAVNYAILIGRKSNSQCYLIKRVKTTASALNHNKSNHFAETLNNIPDKII